jgi:hypothetical protein
MDRRRPRPGRLSRGLLAAALLLAAAGASADQPLRAARWLAPGTDRVVALSTRPAECLPKAANGVYEVEVGRAAFRTPLLLGGQAARAGVSCETCHKAGRSNPDFLFPGVSGKAGTADVTSSLFSSHRGDGVDNPKPIPDLGAAKSTLKISQARDGRALESFIHGLVTEEFDGPQPPAAVLDGLAAYVRALDPKACDGPASQPVRPGDYLNDARRAVKTAREALSRGDRTSAALMIGSARSELGMTYERYQGEALAGDRRALSEADAALAGAAQQAREGAAGADRALERWLRASAGLEARLRRGEDASLFNPRRMSRP